MFLCKKLLILTLAVLAFMVIGQALANQSNQPQAENQQQNDQNGADNDDFDDAENIAEPLTPAEDARIFHDKFSDFLAEYVTDRGLVRYDVLRRRRIHLHRLLLHFDQIDRQRYEKWPEDDKIAFWINAYNLKTLDIVIRNYPIEGSRVLTIFWGPYSVRHLGDIWNDYRFMIMDEQFTLSEIDNTYFRSTFDNPRVFFALTRANLSSPPLRNEPYFGYRLHEQLEAQIVRFLNSDQGFYIDRSSDTVYISTILQPIQSWYGLEFKEQYATDLSFKDKPPAVRAVLNFISDYVSPLDRSYLNTANYRVQYIPYDWTLNFTGSPR